MARTIGGGNVGPELLVTLVPDSTFKSELDSLVAADTKISGSKLVSLTWSNNYECTSPADDAIFDGFVKFCRPIVPSPYYHLTVDLISYIDQNSARHTPRRILHLPYSGTIALQDSVIINSSTYMNVDDGTSGGWGAVIGKDLPTNWVDVIF